MAGDSPEQRQKPDVERQQQNETRERLDVRTEMRMGMVKNDLSILADMLSKEPNFESNEAMQSAYEQCIEMGKRVEQDKGEDVEKLLEETQQFIREQQERFLRKNAQQLRELQNSVTALRRRFLEIPVAYDGDVPADEEIRNALRNCEELELMIRTRINVKNPFASTESVQDFLRHFQAIKRVYNRRFLQNYLERVQGKLPAEASQQLRNIENSWAVDVAKQRKVRRWDGLGWKYETENDYKCDICTKGKNVTGYTAFLERLVREFDARPTIVDGIKRADRTRRQEAVLKDAKYAVRWQLAHLKSVYSHYEFLRSPSGEEEAGWSSTEEGKLYGLVYAAKRRYVEECKRYTELLASVDEDFENVQLRDADLASEHAIEAISMMSMREAIDWVKRMGNLISENHMRSEGLKLTHMKLFAACRQALLKKAEEMRREVADNPQRLSQYQEYCLELAIIFRTSPTIRRYREPPYGPEYFETLQEDLSDSEFADLMAARVMDFENLAYQYGMKELLRGNPLRAVIADMRPNVLRNIETLDQGIRSNPQVQEMITVINGEPATIEELSAQYTVLRQLEEMLLHNASADQAVIQREIEEKFGPHFKRCAEGFEKFLNQGEKGASYADIESVTGVELSEVQKSAYVLLADIRGHGWGNVSDETMQYIRVGTKITVMIAAGVAVGFATAGLGVVSASLIGGTAMTTTGLLINKQSFDSAEEAAVKVGPMWIVDTLGFGTGRILSIGRTAAPLWRSGVIRNYADLRHFFVTASRAGGQKALAQFDEAYSLGQRLLLTGVEGAADVTASTAFDVMLVGGDFGERLTQNMMFLGLPVGMELRRGVWRHLRNATDQQLTLISRTMRDVQTENARLRVLCEGTKLQPQQVARIQSESDLTAVLRNIEQSKADSIRGSWQNIDNSRKVLREQMGVKIISAETEALDVREDAYGKEIIIGEGGYRITNKEANEAYMKKGGWKLHLTVDPKNYRDVDKWLFENHQGQYKLLTGGTHDEGTDFTIYVGSRSDAEEMTRKIMTEIGDKLENNTVGSVETLFSEKVSGRFDIQASKNAGRLGLTYYGHEGVPFDSLAMERTSPAFNGLQRDRSNPEYQADFRRAQEREVKRIHQILLKEYGEYYYKPESTSELREVATDPAFFQKEFPHGAAALTKEDYSNLVDALPNAKFFAFENRVGNWKSVLVVELDGKKYVVRQVGIDDAYLKEYEDVSRHQKIPKLTTREIGGKLYSLCEFLGDNTADFSNLDHLKQIVEHGVQSTKRKTAFDPNKGNFVIHDGDIYYVDRDLRYSSQSTLGEALIENISNTIQNIPRKKEYLPLMMDVVRLYKEKIPSDFSADEQTAMREVAFLSRVDEFVREKLGFLSGDLEPNDFERLVEAIRKIFE